MRADECNIAKSDGWAIQQHRVKHDGDHDVRAHGRKGRAGNEQITEGANEGDNGCPFFDGIAQGQRWDGRKKQDARQQNIAPAMMTICRPEIERMWKRPESR